MYDCRSLPPYSGQCCWHSKGAPFLHRPVLNKTSRLSSARMFVRLYRLLLIHCIYVSVTKPTCPAFSAWSNTDFIRPLKVTAKAIMLCSMALPSKLCATLHVKSNVGSMCDRKPCRSLSVSVFGGNSIRIILARGSDSIQRKKDRSW